LTKEKLSLAMIGEIEQMESALRLEHALELIALHASDSDKRSKAMELARKLRDAADTNDEKTRKQAMIQASAFLTRMPEHGEMLPLNTSEWWFTVSLSQMQPRVAPQTPVYR